MQAGKLKHRITIQRPINTQDPVTGKLIQTWENFKSIFAEVSDLSTRDVIA
ncbi:head-tail adaptor protein, partial [Acinetobacter baumannii]